MDYQWFKRLFETDKMVFVFVIRVGLIWQDKWRNLSVASGQGPRDKSKATKAKANPAEAPAAPLPVAQTSASVAPASKDASTDVVMQDSSRPSTEGINASK